MMRSVMGAVFAAMVPALAGAQEAKRAPLADYVSFCLAVWENARDLPAKAGALGLSDMTGSAGASITIGKTTIRFYKSAQPNLTVGATSTTFKGGKDWSCDVNLPMAVERADLESMEQAADLDGQIATLGAATLGRWKMRQPRPAVLIKAMAGKAFTMLTVQKYEPTPAGANAKLTR
jgi:hypothetical protein